MTDYRDDVDVDDTLDMIRVATRNQARALFLAYLDKAYSQGKVAGVADTWKLVHETVDEAMRK